MEGYRINLSDEALQDLRDIYEYIAFGLKEPQIAVAQVNRIRDGIRSLDTFPNRYKLVDWEPWAGCGIRQMVVDRYLVFYSTDSESPAVNIIRIFHGRRDIPGIAGNNL